MEKLTQKQLKGFVANGVAIDLTDMNDKELLQLKKDKQLSQIGYSVGVYGCNGILIKSYVDNQLYTIIGRVGNLWLF